MFSFMETGSLVWKGRARLETKRSRGMTGKTVEKGQQVRGEEFVLIFYSTKRLQQSMMCYTMTRKGKYKKSNTQK